MSRQLAPSPLAMRAWLLMLMNSVLAQSEKDMLPPGKIEDVLVDTVDLDELIERAEIEVVEVDAIAELSGLEAQRGLAGSWVEGSVGAGPAGIEEVSVKRPVGDQAVGKLAEGRK